MLPTANCPTNPLSAAPTPHSTAASTSISQHKMTASDKRVSKKPEQFVPSHKDERTPRLNKAGQPHKKGKGQSSRMQQKETVE